MIAIVCLTLLIVGGAMVALASNFRPWLERAASSSLGRTTHVGFLQFGWGRHITVEARDIGIANPAWAREPMFLQIGHLSAVIDPLSLLRGVVRYEHVRLSDVVLNLERDADNAVTWKFGVHDSRSESGIALVPKNRTQFPTLRDFVVENGRIVYRSAKKKDIVIDILHGTIASPAEHTPAQLVVNGTYNGVSTRIAGSGMDSFARLRDASIPYGTVLDVFADPVVLRFQGTIGEPLDFDGVRGTLAIDAPALDAALKPFDVETSLPVPLQMAGALQRQGDKWQLGDATGQLSVSQFSGNLVLDEGKRGEADRLHLEVDFPKLDIAPMMTGKNAGSPHGSDEPGLFVDGQLRAGQISWGKVRLSDVMLRGSTGPRGSKSGNMSFDFHGGSAQARLETIEGDSGRVALDASVTGADFSRVASLFGVTGGRVTGKLAMRMNVDFPNSGLEGALANGRGQAAMAVTGGSISGEFLEEASSDLHSLFRKKQGMVALTCLFAAGTLRDGLVHLGPLRLRASDVVLNGSGRVDLVRRRLSVIVQPRSGGTFALDRPLHIEGPLTKPATGLLGGSTARLQEPIPLAPPLQAWAAAVSCPG